MDLSHIIRSMEAIIGGENIFQDEPMRKHTSFRVGGNADVLVTPVTEEQLVAVMTLLGEGEIPYTVIGNGSNLIVKDNGIRGVVVKISDKLASVSLEDGIVHAQAGILLSRLANWALSNELTGFEFASGIPGTLGGAVVMNAGAYDGEMSYVVTETRYYDCTTGELKSVRGEEHKFGYRSSVFQDNNKLVILSVRMKLSKGERDAIKARMEELTRRRKEKQPLEFPSAGSTFKRPTGYFAAKLIDDCGLKGLSVGGAMVSEKHTGFIINTGNATAADILTLIEKVKEEVYRKTNVLLKEEVKILGE